MSDHIDELIELLRSVGATMTLYGKPVTADEVRAHATANVVERFVDRACGKCGHDPSAKVTRRLVRRGLP